MTRLSVACVGFGGRECRSPGPSLSEPQSGSKIVERAWAVLRLNFSGGEPFLHQKAEITDLQLRAADVDLNNFTPCCQELAELCRFCKQARQLVM